MLAFIGLTLALWLLEVPWWAAVIIALLFLDYWEH